MGARAVFLELQLATGKIDRLQVEQQLAAMEARCHARVDRAELLWRQKRLGQQRLRVKSQKRSSDDAALQRIEKLIWSWHLAIAKERRQKTRALERAQRQQWQAKRDRWDGKESLEQFERRVRCRMVD